MAHSCNRAPDRPQRHPIRSFTRREGRLTPAQARALDELLPRFHIPPGSNQLVFTEIFGNNRPVVMEIGFGNGTLLAAQAASHPQFNFIGIEVYRPGIGRLLQQLEQQASANVRVMNEDAAEVMSARIYPGSLFALWLFFPDPWPKKRHHKRRLVNEALLHSAANALQARGILHVATDWQDYARQIWATILTHPRFVPLQPPLPPSYPFVRPLTHFEKRGRLKGHAIADIYASTV